MQRMRTIEHIIDQFTQHYHCSTNIEIRGHILLERGQAVAGLDYELDQLGLGMPGDEPFSWVARTGLGERRLSKREEGDTDEDYC